MSNLINQRQLIFMPNIEQNGHIIENAEIIRESVPVWINFNRSLPPIGYALLSKDENGNIYANIDYVTYIKPIGLYPAIGGTIRDNIIEISEVAICDNPNTDERIKPIENA